MATSKVFCATALGIDAHLVTVEVDLRQRGMPAFTLVGLPDASIREAKERVMSAIRNSGLEFPSAKITVNLAPANWHKEGSEFDLPIAVGIMAQSQMLQGERAPSVFKDYFFIGELGLDGCLRSVPGVLSAALLAQAKDLKGIVVPKTNAWEASLVQGLEVIACENLNQVLLWINGDLAIEPTQIKPEEFMERLGVSPAISAPIDLADIYGNSQAKKALEIAASGGHNLLLIGPPGVGKTLLARALMGILPPLTFEEFLDITRIYSAVSSTDRLGASPLKVSRPFRSPHHSASDAALIGGGAKAQPGEVTLAHRGVLFLDEMPEFPRHVLESMRQPLEDGHVTVSRALAKLDYPSRFILVGAANPCPCGWWGSSERECVCTPYQIMKYRSRISGPLLDRIDIHSQVSADEFKKQAEPGSVIETSAEVRQRVLSARAIQAKRFGTAVKMNAHLTPAEIKTYCKLAPKDQEFLMSVMKKRFLTIRSYSKILKLARTFADLEARESISSQDLSAAISLRCLDAAPSF